MRTFKISKLNPATMTPGSINRELNRINHTLTRINDKLIEDGLGCISWNVLVSENYRLAHHSIDIENRRQELFDEIKHRCGSAMHFCPAGFKAKRA